MEGPAPGNVAQSRHAELPLLRSRHEDFVHGVVAEISHADEEVKVHGMAPLKAENVGVLLLKFVNDLYLEKGVQWK